MGNIKQVRAAALAYYRNLSKEQKVEVSTFFREMDTDGDGTITMEEFKQMAEGYFGDHVNQTFQELDKNGDGCLDYTESITLYYFIKTQRTIIGCHGCKASLFLKGLYFTCVGCFEHNKTSTFDLCVSRYHSRNYVHEHCNFSDDYALLRTKAAYNNSGNSGLTNQVTAICKAFNTTVDIGTGIGNIGSASQLCFSNCSGNSCFANVFANSSSLCNRLHECLDLCVWCLHTIGVRSLL